MVADIGRPGTMLAPVVTSETVIPHGVDEAVADGEAVGVGRSWCWQKLAAVAEEEAGRWSWRRCAGPLRVLHWAKV